MAKKDVWKTLLDQHEKLRSKSGVTLYDRVALLIRVYEDPHFLNDMKEQKKSPVEVVDKCVNDTCANFTELYQIFKMFPKRQQWVSGDLNSMRLQMLEKLRSEQKKNSKSKTTSTQAGDSGRNTATLKQVRELETTIKESNGEVIRLQKELQVANQVIKTLEAQLEAARETIGSLNETISLFKLQQTKPASKSKRARSSK